MAEIFISFVHEDEAIASTLQRILSAHFLRQRIFLSADQWQLRAGEVWLDRIKNELTSTQVLLLLLSNRSIRRPWINFEAGAAWLAGKVLIPICFGGLTKDTLPPPFVGIHGINIPDDTYHLLSSVAHYLQVLAPLPFVVGSEAREITLLKEALIAAGYTLEATPRAG